MSTVFALAAQFAMPGLVSAYSNPGDRNMHRKDLLLTVALALWAAPIDAQDGLLHPTRVIRTEDGKVDQFLGIPYASPPVGALRWKAPVEAASWSGIRDAVRPGSMCVQPADGK